MTLLTQAALFTVSIWKQQVSSHSIFASILTALHILGDPISLIDAIRKRSMKAGVAISPDTPSAAITDDIGNAADMLLVMTVYPGSLNSMNRATAWLMHESQVEADKNF